MVIHFAFQWFSFVLGLFVSAIVHEFILPWLETRGVVARGAVFRTIYILALTVLVVLFLFGVISC